MRGVVLRYSGHRAQRFPGESSGAPIGPPENLLLQLLQLVHNVRYRLRLDHISIIGYLWTWLLLFKVLCCIPIASIIDLSHKLQEDLIDLILVRPQLDLELLLKLLDLIAQILHAQLQLEHIMIAILIIGHLKPQFTVAGPSHTANYAHVRVITALQPTETVQLDLIQMAEAIVEHFGELLHLIP